MYCFEDDELDDIVQNMADVKVRRLSVFGARSQQAPGGGSCRSATLRLPTARAARAARAAHYARFPSPAARTRSPWTVNWGAQLVDGRIGVCYPRCRALVRAALRAAAEQPLYVEHGSSPSAYHIEIIGIPSSKAGFYPAFSPPSQPSLGSWATSASPGPKAAQGGGGVASWGSGIPEAAKILPLAVSSRS
jgi:hypothetical protein